MRVLLAGNARGWTGSGRVMRMSAAAAVAAGHEVALLGPSLPPELVPPGVEPVVLDTRGRAAVPEVHRVLRDLQPDLVHAHERGIAGLLGVVTRWQGAGPGRHRVPVVEHVHSTYTDRRRTSFRADRLLACGTGIRDQLVTGYRRPARRVGVLLNAVPRAPLGLHRDPIPVMVGVGRLVPGKCPDMWAEAVREARRSVPGLQGVWLGGGPLLERCRERHPEPFLAWPGYLDVPGELGTRTGVLVSASEREGLPLAMLESLAAGMPVVARDVGSVADAVVEGVTGRLVAADAGPVELAAAAVAVLTERPATVWAAAAVRRHAELFTPERFADGLLAEYRALLG